MNPLKTLEELKQKAPSYPYSEPIQEWKNQGKKVMGYLCTYVPEEIIYAAGMMPLRITGAEKEIELENANAYLYINTCSFARSCIELALAHEFDFLDGLVGVSTCDGVRRLYDVWRKYVPLPFEHIMFVPRRYHEEAHKIFLEELTEFKEHLEAYGGVKITDEALREAIKVCNRTRELLGQLYEFGKEEPPRISGTETVEILNASRRLTKDQYNQFLEKVIKEVGTRKPLADNRVRLLLNGSILTNPEYVKSIEELRAWVVVDEICTGTRWWGGLVDTSVEPPMKALAERYLIKPACARMYPSDERINFLINLVKDFKVQGVITEIIRYCVPYGHDVPMTREILEEHGVPMLQLDVEYGQSGTGQIRTRVEAFVEMIERGGK